LATTQPAEAANAYCLNGLTLEYAKGIAGVGSFRDFLDWSTAVTRKTMLSEDICGALGLPDCCSAKTTVLALSTDLNVCFDGSSRGLSRHANGAGSGQVVTPLGSRECIATTTAHAEFSGNTVEKLLS
jgi:hypothetical protein